MRKRVPSHIILTSVLLSLAAVIYFARLYLEADLKQLSASLVTARGALKNQQDNLHLEPPIATTFVESLPPARSPEFITDVFRHSAVERGVGMITISISKLTPTQLTLGRMQVNVVLRGEYSGLKNVLADVIDNQSGQLFERLTIHPTNAPNNLEAQLGLLVVSQPQRAALPTAVK